MGLLYVKPTLFVNALLHKLIYTNLIETSSPHHMSTSDSKPP